MYMPHPRNQAEPDAIGCFMFFAWLPLLVIGLIQLIFAVLGWLFEQPWFYVVLALGLVVAVAASCVAS
jgi:hypothetical protein